MPVIDYDAFQREKAARDVAATNGDKPPEPTFFIIGGKKYQLPTEVPATVVLDVVRLRKGVGLQKEAQVEQMIGIGDALFGPETFREILEVNKLGASDIGAVVLHALGATGNSSEDARPNRRTRRARKDST